jgi:hypothetical protein
LIATLPWIRMPVSAYFAAQTSVFHILFIKEGEGFYSSPHVILLTVAALKREKRLPGTLGKARRGDETYGLVNEARGGS